MKGKISRQKKWLLKHPFYDKLWRLANKDRINKLKRLRRKKNNLKYIQKDREKLTINKDIIAQFKYQPCVDCGKQYNSFIMHFDHREPKYKFRSISMMKTYSLQSLLSEISKCDVVCANCHGLRTIKRIHDGKSTFFGMCYAQ